MPPAHLPLLWNMQNIAGGPFYGRRLTYLNILHPGVVYVGSMSLLRAFFALTLSSMMFW